MKKRIKDRKHLFKAIKVKNPVYLISLIVSLGVAAWGSLSSDTFDACADWLMEKVTSNLSWLYLSAMLFFVVFCIVVACGKYGTIRLGPEDSRPEYSTASWFAMLFGAGMGIGLIFWGIAEPLSHYITPIEGTAPASGEAAQFAMRASFLHWGLHPWAGYAVIGLGLAYFQFRKDQPGLISSLFLPFLDGKKIRGAVGKAIDIFAVIATIAGVATSLGMGTLQINSGLSHLFHIPSNALTWFLIILGIASVYVWTAVKGVEKGMKTISNLNLSLALFLLAAAFLSGPTVQILNILVNGVGQYFNNFISDSLALNPFGDNTWLSNWRIFYWAWWIAWAPFVGTFIARISRGRTVREFILGVIAAPAATSIIWFSVFGGMALHAAGSFKLDELSAITATPETALFEVFSQYRFGTLFSAIALILLVTFFITSANSATFVLSMFSSGGDLNPPGRKKVIWGIVQAGIAFALLLSGGLKSLQTASVAAAAPFIFIMLFACWGLLKAFREEWKERDSVGPSN